MDCLPTPGIEPTNCETLATSRLNYNFWLWCKWQYTLYLYNIFIEIYRSIYTIYDIHLDTRVSFLLVLDHNDVLTMTCVITQGISYRNAMLIIIISAWAIYIMSTQDRLGIEWTNYRWQELNAFVTSSCSMYHLVYNNQILKDQNTRILEYQNTGITMTT